MHDTMFAPAVRATPEVLTHDIAQVASNPMVDALLEASGALLAVLNAERQVVAVNDSLLKWLGVPDGKAALGLRPGQVLGCVHADEKPNGCGTTAACGSCGAVLSIVSALKQGRPRELPCVLQARRDGAVIDLYLQIRAAPFDLDARRYVLLFLRDDTEAHQRTVIEHLFFHDLNNLLFGLEMAVEAGDDHATLKRLVEQVLQQVRMQRAMVLGGTADYHPQAAPVLITQVLGDLAAVGGRHPASRGRHLALAGPQEPTQLVTDRALLHRVLLNMLINALEAAPHGSEVRAWVETTNSSVTFRVWNPGLIPPAIAARIFQRNFSTKAAEARGLGTWAMKLFGEQVLGGRVGFSTGASGTTFSITLPRAWPGGPPSRA